MKADSDRIYFLIRPILTAALAACWLFGAAPQTYALPGRAASPVVGTWTGESTCFGNRPACKNEVVVYRFEPIAGKPGMVTMLADKIIEGKREPMGKLDFQYDEAKGTLSCEFTKGQTHGLWQFQISGETMEGTLVVLPDRTLGRRVKVKRVREDQVPAAPARELYEAAMLPRMPAVFQPGLLRRIAARV